MNLNKNQKAFLALLREGLWGKADANLNAYYNLSEGVDWNEVYQLAREQSVQGLVISGLEHSNMRPPKELLLQWICEVQQVELRNKAMNGFIADLIDKLRKEDVYCILLKGQGVAQCYEKPLLRASGDIDLLLSEENYNRAKNILIPFASEVENENETTKHQALVMKDFDVELHGRMPFSLSKRVDGVIDLVLEDLFFRGNVRSWDCDGTQVFLPSSDNDVILVFTHFLHHFFIEGVGLRQICDWCRLLYTNNDTLNYGLLESRIRKMGLMSEWKAFYNLANRYLGMLDLDSRFMIHDSRFNKKADRIMELVLESGNFGHNKDLSYRTKYSGITYKIVAAWRRLLDFGLLIPVFPLDAPKFYLTYMLGKLK